MKINSTIKPNQKILIIAAHPDDEVLSCGGTIAKLAKGGNKVYCLFLGRGKSSRFEIKNNKVIEREQNILEKEAKKAGKILGISKIFFEDFPDQKYDTIPFLDVVKAIEKVKNQIKPDIVFTHHLGDLNLDHQITLKAVLTACRPLKNETVKKIYSFEVPSSTEWSVNPQFSPNFFVDVKKTFNKKIEALKAYKSEMREYPHPRCSKSLEIIARRWGIAVGRDLVEAFELIREIDSFKD